MAQWVEHLTLDFGSDHDPRAAGSSPKSGAVPHNMLGILSLPSPLLVRPKKKKKKTVLGNDFNI